MEEEDELDEDELAEDEVVAVSNYLVFSVSSLTFYANKVSFEVQEGCRGGCHLKEAEGHFVARAGSCKAPHWLFAAAARTRGGSQLQCSKL